MMTQKHIVGCKEIIEEKKEYKELPEYKELYTRNVQNQVKIARVFFRKHLRDGFQNYFFFGGGAKKRKCRPDMAKKPLNGTHF